MAIQNEFDRDKDVGDYVRGKNKMVQELDAVISILNKAVAFKTKYPADASEINTDIAWVKNKAQQIIDGY